MSKISHRRSEVDLSHSSLWPSENWLGTTLGTALRYMNKKIFFLFAAYFSSVYASLIWNTNSTGFTWNAQLAHELEQHCVFVYRFFSCVYCANSAKWGNLLCACSCAFYYHYQKPVFICIETSQTALCKHNFAYNAFARQKFSWTAVDQASRKSQFLQTVHFFWIYIYIFLPEIGSGN